MPYGRPSLSDLRTQAIEDITTSGVPGLDGLLRNAVLRVLALVMSGLAYLVYGYVDWVSQMAVPFTARDEFLEAWAGLIGIYRKDATPASGAHAAQFTGTAGRTILTGAALTRQDGTPYTATADATLDGTGVALVSIIAAVNGAATDCDPGVFISLDDPPDGINAGGQIVAPVTGGSDMETDDELRTRMLAKYAAPPQGGAASDYVEWATEVPGCTRAWPIPHGYGYGSVAVAVMFDDVESAHDGFPQGTNGCAAEEPNGPTATGDQALVAEHIWPLQPVPVLVYVMAPVPFPVAVTVADLEPGDAATQAAVTASLHDAFRAIGEVGGSIWPSQLYAAVLATPGVQTFAMTAPTAPVSTAPPNLPVLGAVTFA